MKISRLKIQGFRTVNRSFDCSLEDLSVFVGRNNAGKSCAVRALDLFFNRPDSPDDFIPHIRINPGAKKKTRYSIIIGVWLSGLPSRPENRSQQTCQLILFLQPARVQLHQA